MEPLSETAQQVAYWLAVSHGKLYRSQLASLLARDGRRPSIPRVEGGLDELEEHGWLAEDCVLTRDVREQVLRPHIVDGSFIRDSEVVDDVVQVHRNYWKEGNRERRIRRALLQGEAQHRDLTGDVDIADWFSSPLHLEGLALVESWVQGPILDAISSRAFWLDIEPHPLLDWSRSLGGTLVTARMLAVACREALLAGELEHAEGYLDRLEDHDAHAFGGWLALIRGDLKAATKAFQQARREQKRLTGTPYLGGPEGVMMVLAFLLRDTKSATQQAGTALREVRSEAPYLCRDPARPFPELERLKERLTGKETQLPHPTHPFAVLLRGLMASWCGLEMPPLESALETARAHGWRWIEHELLALEDPEASLGTALVSHRAVRPAWELKLDAVSSLLPAAPSAPQKKREKRVVWRLWNSKHGFALQARVQTPKGRDGWTKGRAVANSSLGGAGLPEMTEHDRAVARALKRERGWYGKDEYSWSAAKAWPALVGHPAVFDDDALLVPLEIVGRKPRLVVRKRDGKLALAIEPEPGTGLVVEETPDGYAVTHFDSKQRQLASALDGLQLPKQGQERLTDLLGRLETHFELEDSANVSEAVELAPQSEPLLQLSPQGAGLLARVRVRPLGAFGPAIAPGTGRASLATRHEGVRYVTQRDLDQERQQVEALLRRCPVLAASEVDELDFATDTLLDSLTLLEELREQGVACEWPEGESFRVQRVQSSSVRVTARAADWLDVQGEIEIDADLTLSLTELLSRLGRSNGRYVELDDGTYLALTGQLRRHLDALGRVGRTKGDKVQLPRLAAPLVEGLAQSADNAKLSAGAQQQLDAWNRPSTAELPGGLQATLRPYQRDGFRWLSRLAELGAGACLADDMGLGKTLQILTLLLSRQKQGPALVIAPTSVCAGWVEQAWRFTPSLRVHRLRESEREVLVTSAGPGDVVVASYGLLVSESALLASRAWDTVVLDESQAIKNSVTQRHQAARALQAQVRIVATGTPVENHPGELWAQFAFLNPTLLGSERQFRSRFDTPIREGDREAARQLRALVLPFVLRRTKSAVLDDLPEKTEVVLEVERTAEEVAFYEALRLRALERLESDPEHSAVSILAELTQLRLACCSPRLVAGEEAPEGSKLAAFAELVEQLRDGGHRALVFSQFVKHLSLLRSWLDAQGIAYQYLDGSTPAKERERRVQAFQQGDDPLFLISLKAGGTGLNLTAADYVVHMDPWWNPAVEDQASDRAHRIGQQRPVTVYRLVTTGTIEERMLSLHHQKRELSDELLLGADSTRLDPKMLLGLLRSEP